MSEVLQSRLGIRLTAFPTILLVILRIAIGWHFLYEGMVKLIDPNWTAAGYLASSKSVFSGVFAWIVAHPGVLGFVDTLNIWGLIFIGLGLILGCFSRTASFAGAILLLLYYSANPPFLRDSTGVEGNYILIDKNLIEAIALGLLSLIPTGHIVGLDRVLAYYRNRKPAEAAKPEEEEITAPPGAAVPRSAPSPESSSPLLPRRQLVKSLAGFPLLGGFGFAAWKKYEWDSWEERHLLAAGDGVDSVSSATIKTFNYSSLKDLKGEMMYGQIGDLKLSRMFLGGNLMGGWAHARDLIYVSKLVKQYHTDQKIFDTFRLAEDCGLNTILTNPVLARVINAYWRKEGGKIQFISDCAYGGDVMTGIKVSVDGGAHACYVQGGISDRLVAEGKTEEIGKALDLIRQNGMPAGIGAHALETVQGCVEAGLKPDYWVKTLHHCDYWSAGPEEDHDNIWCKKPAETVAYMESLEEPWIAFKILAAGAIEPAVGFRYAFESGADFICVGMYDFQIVDDVNIANELLASDFSRSRPWRA